MFGLNEKIERLKWEIEGEKRMNAVYVARIMALETAYNELFDFLAKEIGFEAGEVETNGLAFGVGVGYYPSVASPRRLATETRTRVIRTPPPPAPQTPA